MKTTETRVTDQFDIKFDSLPLRNGVASITWYGTAPKFNLRIPEICQIFRPVTQIYGVCVDRNRQALITSIDGINWGLPGGTPKKYETLAEALARELAEEANITIKPGHIVLGVQKIETRDQNNFSQPPIYQVRVLCRINQIYEAAEDPAIGIVRERKFVPIKELNAHLKWGKIGQEIAKISSRLLE